MASDQRPPVTTHTDQQTFGLIREQRPPQTTGLEIAGAGIAGRMPKQAVIVIDHHSSDLYPDPVRVSALPRTRSVPDGAAN
jgi:hypothetical protein